MKAALSNFQTRPLKEAACQLLAKLGYQSDRTLTGAGSSPQSFLELFGSGHAFDPTKALVPEWKSADLLFQLTDQELSRESSLFTDDSVQRGLLKSYIFIAIELKGTDYARGKFSAIARQLNRLFPMPVMVIFKHGERLTIAVINRRRNKLDDNKDVLEKATLIRDITFAQPHRGHLDILASLALTELKHPQKKPITDFDTLHAAWEKIFNVELLNKNFYDDLANWFFWAKKHCHFPLYDERADKYDLFRDTDKVREHEAKNLIRLLTRTLFVWFIKERGLVPDSLFSPTDLKKSVLKSFDPESKETNYYKAVLQNLFFATLNQTHGERVFRNEGQHQNTTTLLRYEGKLRSPQDFVRSFEETTPFLNGGLFECLDRPHPTKVGPQGGRVIIYEDGFSDRKDNPLTLPDFLFFGAKRFDDLSGEHSFGLASKKNAEVRGLINILDSYKFTIVENTPIDQEIALDPELLGQVFENLLASYNPETKTTARKQTGSFYTPRAIVDYMVEESLKAHLTRILVEKARVKEPDARAGLDILFAYTEKEHAFTSPEVATLIAAIDTCKILDPACGSGAFPMGTLQKLVFILSKLDPDNKKWQQRQIDAASTIPDSSARDAAITAIEKDFAENADDYGRKLYLIENCLYGVDIQSIATQVSKLRFFISLIVDQHVNRKSPNFGVRPLPNLESKFVTADTLIKIEKPETGRLRGQGNLFEQTEVAVLQSELKSVRHNLFSAKTPRTKEKYRTRDKELREAIAAELKLNGWESEAANNLARWDPYDQNASAPYFDPEWMFGERSFDIVIGNPPFIQIQKFPAKQKEIWQKQKFATYAAMADIYCLFYERGSELLKDSGHLCYITSNKWMRAGYGEQLRDFLASKVNTTAVLDFGMAQNFGAATTYTCVTSLAKQPSAHRTLSCYASDTAAAMSEPADYFARNAVPLTALGGGPWVVLPPERYAIKAQVEAKGVALEKWEIQINYGIKTGFNDAFYLTQEERDTFVAEDPRCAEFLVPLMRGRYIERYRSNWDGTWMIATFPSYNLNASQLPRLILKRLESSRTMLEPKPRGWKGTKWDGRKAGSYQWFETQDPIAYSAEFTKPKIIYPNMTKYLPFYFDRDDKFFGNQKCFIITSEVVSLPSLIAILNSSVFRCCFRDSFPELLGNTYELSKIFFEKIPVKKPTAAEVSLFERLVPLVQFAKADAGASPGVAAFLEDLIDACVMESYFREHMAERDLLFHDTVAPHLTAYDPAASEVKQRDFLTHLHQTLNAPSHPIRNRLLRLTADSPDLLAIIKAEGKV